MAGERVRLTKAQRRALEWIAAREPVGWFDASGPYLWFVRRLCRIGLLETCGRKPGDGLLDPVRYRVSPAGRAALAEAEGKGGGNG